VNWSLFGWIMVPVLFAWAFMAYGLAIVIKALQKGSRIDGVVGIKFVAMAGWAPVILLWHFGRFFLTLVFLFICGATYLAIKYVEFRVGHEDGPAAETHERP
jgi:hypothetical protein